MVNTKKSTKKPIKLKKEPKEEKEIIKGIPLNEDEISLKEVPFAEETLKTAPQENQIISESQNTAQKQNAQVFLDFRRISNFSHSLFCRILSFQRF